MRVHVFDQSAVSGLSTGRCLLRLVLVLLVLAATAMGASSPAVSAVLEPSSRMPRTSLADTSAIVPEWGSPPLQERKAGRNQVNRAPGGSDGQTAGRTPAPNRAAPPPAGQPSPSHWAVVIGADTYQAPTADTIGSTADARLLTNLLDRHGWRDDHVRTLTDAQATKANVRRAFAWLARKTDDDSTVVVSFSGHMDHRHTADDIVTGLWTQDNERIWRAEFARMMRNVDADQMWISLQGCHSGGLATPGVEGDNRLVTYSSRASQASYEDPRVGHSVMGNYLFREGLAQGRGNGANPQDLSVQSAFEWAAPRAHRRTGGKQTPLMSDGLEQPFTLDVAPTPD